MRCAAVATSNNKKWLPSCLLFLVAIFVVSGCLLLLPVLSCLVCSVSCDYSKYHVCYIFGLAFVLASVVIVVVVLDVGVINIVRTCCCC